MACEVNGRSYADLLAAKAPAVEPSGHDRFESSATAFDFQNDLTRWAVRKGRAAVWADCGLGKTRIALHWAAATEERTLILTPLAVAPQFVEEGKAAGVEVTHARYPSELSNGINVTNYDRLHLFDDDRFGAVVLDESSCLKDYTSKTRNALIDRFADTPWRLACSATPAPNDTMELGNHAEFLGAMSRTEMLASFFVHDGGETQKWRLKGHAMDEFWSWISSWAIALRAPSDLGYSDDGYELPSLRMHEVQVDADASIAREAGLLFVQEARGLASQREARRGSLEARCDVAAEIANKSTGPFLCWCDLNAESAGLAERIPDAVEIRGSDKIEHKEEAMLAFRRGDVRVLVTKPSIAGWGVNWQHCSQVAFVGLSNSFEQYYQAIRRTWRFGQENPVDCHIVTSTAEAGVLANLRRKQRLAREMGDRMIEHMAGALMDAKTGQTRMRDSYNANKPMERPAWM